MKTKESITAYDLKIMADKFVDTRFNFIQSNVLETMSNQCLYEHIRAEETDSEEFLDNYNLWDEFWAYYCEGNDIPEKDHDDEIEWAKEKGADFYKEELNDFISIEHESDFDRWRDERGNENYPMWNTCFEFREEPSEDVIQAAIDAGFGVIEGMEDFNTTLFVAGCGYSFYGAHWIPFMLNLPWNKELKESAKGVDYSGM